MQDPLLTINGNMISLMKRFNNKNILLKIIYSNKIINFTKIKETRIPQENLITKIQTIILILNLTNKNKGQNKRERITS